MIEIKTYNEKDNGKGVSYDCKVHIEGKGDLVIHQLILVFDKIYQVDTKLFETALLMCKYTEDHT